MPFPPRKTIGTLSWPPDMYRTLAALFTSWSKQTNEKLQLMNSIMGRNPAIAAPTPNPENPASEIGVSNTRRGPKCASMPSETLYAPLYSPTSSPMRNTSGSRSISSHMAWRRASLYWISGIQFRVSGGGVEDSGRALGPEAQSLDLRPFLSFLEWVVFRQHIRVHFRGFRMRAAVGELDGIIDD